MGRYKEKNRRLLHHEAVENGQFPYEEKIKFMSHLKPWQIKEAYAYFE